jgi:hypothetical protein
MAPALPFLNRTVSTKRSGRKENSDETRSSIAQSQSPDDVWLERHVNGASVVSKARLHILDAGHFALDAEADQIADLVVEFMDTQHH